MASSVERLTPREIGQGDERHLAITWADGHRSLLEVRALRLACPCAACIDEWSGTPRLDPATVAATIAPTAVRSVGLYALSIEFNDGHQSGIYPFELLRKLCPCGECAAA